MQISYKTNASLLCIEQSFIMASVGMHIRFAENVVYPVYQGMLFHFSNEFPGNLP